MAMDDDNLEVVLVVVDVVLVLPYHLVHFLLVGWVQNQASVHAPHVDDSTTVLVEYDHTTIVDQDLPRCEAECRL